MHGPGNSYKGNHLTGAGLLFRGFVHYYHGGKCSSMQADMVQEKKLRVPCLELQATGRDSEPLDLA